jgi:signal peptidase I
LKATELAGVNTPTGVSDPGYGWLHALQSTLWVLLVTIFITCFLLQPIRIPSASMEPTLRTGDLLLIVKLGPDAQPSFEDPMAPTGIRRGDVIVFRYPVDPAVHLVKRVAGVPGDRVHLVNGHVWVNDRPLSEPWAAFRGPDDSAAVGAASATAAPDHPGATPHDASTDGSTAVRSTAISRASDTRNPPQPGPANAATGTSATADLYRDDFPHLTRPDPATEAAWWMRMHTLVRGGELTVPPGEFFVLGDNRNNSDDSRYWGLVPRNAIDGRPLLVYLSLRTQQDSSGEGLDWRALRQLEFDRSLRLVR